MGNPDIYCQKALQYFAHSLIYCDNVKQAKEFLDENNNQKLIDFLQMKKASMSDVNFAFEAGRCYQMILDEASKEGTDSLNASIAGVDMFLDAIGIQITGYE